MSIEVDQHEYWFRNFDQQKRAIRTRKVKRNDVYAKGFEPLTKDFGGTLQVKPQLDPSHKPSTFRHNPLHDIESLWWLLVYLTLYRSVDIQDDTQERRDKQRAFYRPFFYDRDSRKKAFMIPGIFLSGLEQLPPALHPVAYALDGFRRDLVTRYSEVERTSGDIDNIDHTAAEEIVDGLYIDLIELARMFPEHQDLKLVPIR